MSPKQPIASNERDRRVSAPGDGYTIEVVARSEGVSVATIRRWVREKRFPAPVKRAGIKGRCVWHAETLAALRVPRAA
jgi:transposase